MKVKKIIESCGPKWKIQNVPRIPLILCLNMSCEKLDLKIYQKRKRHLPDGPPGHYE